MGRLLSWVNRNFGEHTLGLYFAFVCDCVLVGEVHLERAEERGGGEGHSAVESLPLQPAKFTRKKCKQCARHTNSHTHTPFHTPAHTDSWTPKTNESANHCLCFIFYELLLNVYEVEKQDDVIKGAPAKTHSHGVRPQMELFASWSVLRVHTVVTLTECRCVELQPSSPRQYQLHVSFTRS